MRSWIAAAMGLGAASQVNRLTLEIHLPPIFAGVHSAAKANGIPPSTLNRKGWRSSPRRSGLSHSK